MMRTWGWLLCFALVGCGEYVAADADTEGGTGTGDSTSGTNPTATAPLTDGSSDTSTTTTGDPSTSTTADPTTAADESSSSGASSVTVSGVVSGLNGSITLQNNEGDDLTLDADGAFTFETPLEAGAAYAVTASEIPGVQLCVVDRGEGNADEDVSDVLVRCGNKALFDGRTSAEGSEPWITDGTAEGTIPLGDLSVGGGSSDPVFVAGMGGRLIFSARTSSTGVEFWSTDGTAEGTAMLDEVEEGPVSSGAVAAGVLDGMLVLQVRGALWVTDGVPGGVLEQFFDPEPSTENSVTGAAVLGDVIIFQAQLSGDREPWVTDGTEGGTMLLADLNPNGSSDPEFFGRAVGGLIYFSAVTEDGREVWATDGTSEGTVQVIDAEPGPGWSNPIISGWLGERVLFSVLVPGQLSEPFISDGTPRGTAGLGDLNPNGSSDALGFTALGDLAVFRANDGALGRELWATDGTPEGTELVLDIDEGAATGFDSGRLYAPANPSPEGDLWAAFAANNGVDGLELWATDGTAEGTEMLLDVFPGASWSFPEQIQTVGPDLVFFFARSPEEGCEPYVTDGTPGGTVALPPVFPGPGDGCG